MSKMMDPIDIASYQLFIDCYQQASMILKYKNRDELSFFAPQYIIDHACNYLRKTSFVDHRENEKVKKLIMFGINVIAGYENKIVLYAHGESLSTEKNLISIVNIP